MSTKISVKSAVLDFFEKTAAENGVHIGFTPSEVAAAITHHEGVRPDQVSTIKRAIRTLMAAGKLTRTPRGHYKSVEVVSTPSPTEQPAEPEKGTEAHE